MFCNLRVAAAAAAVVLFLSSPGQRAQVRGGEPDAKEITNTLGMKLRLIPAGTFKMGSPKDETGRSEDEPEGPVHEVQLTKKFYLGAHTVTRGQFRKFLEAEKYVTEAEKEDGSAIVEGFNPETGKFDRETKKYKWTWRNPGFEQTDDHPVVMVTWNDAKAFCAWLSKQEGKTYRLPTEAEWEYSCRAGTTTRFFSGDKDESLQKVANVADKAFKAKWKGERPAFAEWDDGFPFTAPVGSFKPNPWGLYDMQGNVCQWCDDGHRIYEEKRAVDPRVQGFPGGCYLFRGGSFDDYGAKCRSAKRARTPSQLAGCALGFRVLLEPSAQEKAPPKAQEVRRFETGEQGVIRVAVSPDGRFALSGGTDGTVRLWQLATGKELKKLEGHTGQTYTVAFSPNGQLALSGGDDNQLLLWNLDSGEQVRSFTGHTGNVCGAAFSPDGKRIASGSWDKTIRVWDVATGQELKKLEGHTEGIMAVAFSPNGKRLASAGGDDKTVRLWDLESGTELQRFEGHSAMVRAVAFLPDGQHVLSGSWKEDGTARLWDVLTGKELHCLKGIPEGIHGVAVSPDGLFALVAGGNGVQLWNLNRGQHFYTFHALQSATDAVFLPDRKHALLASGGDKTLRLMRLPGFSGFAPGQ